MKGKRKLTQRILSLMMVFAMVMGMLLEPVQIYAAQPGEDAGQMKAGPADPQPDGNGGTTDQGGTPGGNSGETTPKDTKITLDPTRLNLVEKEAGKIEAKVTPAEKVEKIKWSVATDLAQIVVDSKNNGTVTIIAKEGKEGTERITATIEEGTETVSATAEVIISRRMHTVSVAKVIESVSEVSVPDATIELTDSKNSNKKYTATYVEKDGDYQVTCPSGTYTMTCTPPSGFTGTELEPVTVRVNDEGDVSGKKDFSVTLGGISLSDGNEKTLKVNKTTTWTINKEFNVANETISWESNDSNTASIDQNGLITANKEGTAYITVTIHTPYGDKKVTEPIDVDPWETKLDLAVTPQGTNNKIEKIAAAATVTNSDGEKVPEGDVKFTLIKKRILLPPKRVAEESVSVQNGAASHIFEASRFGFSGNYEVKAVYIGTNGRYNDSSEVTKQLDNLKDIIPIQFMKIDLEGQKVPIQDITKPQNVTYGDKTYKIIVDKGDFEKEAELTEEEKSQVTYTYAVKQDAESPVVLKVDQEGNVTLLKASSVSNGQRMPSYITVTRNEVGHHQGISVDYPIIVNPKEITIDVNAYNQSLSKLEYSKIYDKENQVFHRNETKDMLTNVSVIPLAGIESNSEGVQDDVHISSLKGTLPEGFTNVQVDKEGKVIPYSEDADVVITEAVLDGTNKDNYVLNINDTKLATKVTINPRRLGLQVSEGERQYGHWNEFTKEPTVSAKDSTTEIDGLLKGDTVTFPKATELEIPNENKPDYGLGTQTEKLTVYSTIGNPPAANGNPGNNYYFDFTDVEMGNINIVEEQISEAYLNFHEEKENVYISKEDANKGNVWVNSSTTNYKIDVISNNQLYDEVYLADRDMDSNNDVKISENGTGIDFSKVDEDGTVKTYDIYLKNSKNNAVSQKLNITLYVDTKMPEVTEDNVYNKMTAIKGIANAITFGKFYNKLADHKATATVSDFTGSGVSEWGFNIMKGSSDEDFTEEKITTYVDPQNTTCTWSPLYQKDEVKDNATLKGEITLPDEENNYIILIKVKDNVGHQQVYASNGVIVDYQNPSAEINIVNPSSTGVYKENVNLDIKVFDTVSTNGIKSAVKTVDIVVKNGDTVTDKKQLLNIEEVTGKDNWKLSELDAFNGDPTKYQVLKYSVEANEANNSNNVKVVVTVTDNADNEYVTEQDLMIDITNPVLEATYTSTAKPQNGNYYNAPMTAEIIYTERNFSKEKAYLWFDVTTENTKLGQYSLDELASLGVQYEWADLGDKQQDNIEVNALTDGRQHKLILTFDKDDHYVFTPYIRDLSEPATVISGEEQKFNIDQKKPEIKVTYSSEGKDVVVPLEEVSRFYSGKPVTAKVEIEEHNFALDGEEVPVDVKVETTKVGANETIPDYNKQEKENSKDVWGTNGDVRTSTYTFNSDANYTHSITYKDLAGNTVSYGPGYFTVDKTQPTGTVEIKGFGFWESLLEKITFGLFSPSTVDVVMTGADHTSPVNPVQFARFHDQMTRDDLENYNGWSSASQEKPESAAFSVSPDEQFIVYTKVTDYAGNYQYFSSDGMIVDSTKPAPVVTITNLSQAQNGIFNENVTLQIDVEDPTAGETYSGLEKVWYTVSAAGNVTTSETIELLNNSGNKVQGNKTFSKVITVPADVYNSNDVKVQAFATDFSGNQGDSEITELKIDVTNPTISVSWDLNNPLNGRYYKDTRTATVTVTDRNFDPNNVRFSITNTDGTSANIGGWSSSSNIGVSDTATSTCQVSFPADGDYTFTLGCTDLAGNSGEYGQTDEFTIDKTIPIMTVSYDNNNARNGNYFKETRTATVTIREHNFNAADVRAAITASLEGSGISTPSISGFSGSGDVHTATVNYSTDGDYTFDIDYTDMAGNAAADYTQDSFTVDLTAPELEITDVEDKSANNDAVAPKVEATDVNYDAKGITMTLTGANNGNVEVGKIVSAIQNGQSMKFNDFARTEEMDDLYKLQAKAVDKAGNETQKEIMFSVNRYGSVFILDNDTKDWLKTGDEGYTYIREEKEVGIREINVDAIESRSITVNRDGDLASLKENTDFTVKNSGSDAQWKEAHYVIAKNNFEEEGNYTVILNTQDKAQNSMNNTSVKKANKNLPIEFAVDKTAPTVVVSGVEDDAQYRAAERAMIVDAKDNLALTKVSISIDREKTVYDGEELLKDNGVIETAVASANRWQNIEITAEDAAGNVLGQSKEALEGEPVVLRVLVTPNIVIQYYMNKPLFYGSIAAIVIMAGLIIFLVAKKKKG